MKKHTVHLWKLYRRSPSGRCGEVICIKCGIIRSVPWKFDPEELAQ